MRRGRLPLHPSLGCSSSSKDGTAGISFPYHGSLCVHATERRQQEFEFDSVFSGQASQVRRQCSGQRLLANAGG